MASGLASARQDDPVRLIVEHVLELLLLQFDHMFLIEELSFLQRNQRLHENAAESN